MKILVFGSKGQLGTELCMRLSLEKLNYLGLDYEECDITLFEQVSKCVDEYKPDVIINCSAFTQVDNCEEEKDKAYANKCNWCKKHCN